MGRLKKALNGGGLAGRGLGDPHWRRVRSAPKDLPLYEIWGGVDVRQWATVFSCQQDIAGNGDFAVAFLAEYLPTLQRHGSWMYRRLHWEAARLASRCILQRNRSGAGQQALAVTLGN